MALVEAADERRSFYANSPLYVESLPPAHLTIADNILGMPVNTAGNAGYGLEDLVVE